MSRRKPLTCQSRKVCIVIRKNKDIPISKIKEYCIDNFERYAFIEHRNDISPESGETIPVHYHIIGDMKGEKVAFSTRLNTIVDYFKLDNANGIEIDQYNTFEGSLQYLIHKNNPEKTAHKEEEIVHNLSESDFKIFMNADIGNVITFDLLLSVVTNANNIIDVIKEVGLGNYRTWRVVIWDMWNTINGKEDYYSKL